MIKAPNIGNEARISYDDRLCPGHVHTCACPTSKPRRLDVLVAYNPECFYTAEEGR